MYEQNTEIEIDSELCLYVSVSRLQPSTRTAPPPPPLNSMHHQQYMSSSSSSTGGSPTAGNAQPGSVAGQAVGNMPLLASIANVKDSRWLTLEVCREYQRGKCTRSDQECKFAHPPTHVEVNSGKVIACFDSLKVSPFFSSLSCTV